ncbi:MAG: Crp/Fnr family transcriptional regulator [Cyclobacteriaceae bacterium]|nr:Crp/Fnr family transcriptional regulator [Cyclobacteriaceae bacterium]
MSEKTTNIPGIREMLNRYCSQEWLRFLEFYTRYDDFQKNQSIFKEGEPIECIHIIENGKVKIIGNYKKSEERIVRLASDGQIIGHRGIGGDYRYSVSAICLTDVRISLIPVKIFLDLLKANNELCFHFMLFFAEELKRSEQNIKDLESMTVLQRTAKALLTNIESFGYDAFEHRLLDFTCSRSELAQMASTTYESLVRALRELNEKNIIQIAGKNIYIQDENALRNILKDEPTEISNL